MRQVSWQALAPLPRVSRYIRGKRSYTWEERVADYEKLPKEPVLITAEMMTPILHAERQSTHLDGILASAVLTDHPHPSAFGDIVTIPLPLDLVWVSSSGYPLWASTPLVPVDGGIVSREYWHKRYPSHRAEFGNKQSANTSAGRWREFRVPVAAHSTSKLVAMAIGNMAELQRLLDGVTHIGKKSSIGYGRVVKWEVIPHPHTLEDVLSNRAVPVESGLTDGRMERHRGWTPPYWHAAKWLDCIVP